MRATLLLGTCLLRASGLIIRVTSLVPRKANRLLTTRTFPFNSLNDSERPHHDIDDRYRTHSDSGSGGRSSRSNEDDFVLVDGVEETVITFN